MDLITQINRLESKLLVTQLSPEVSLINIDHLIQKDMDIREFILTNFVQHDTFQINYEKVNSALPFIQEIQQKTCEDIALSVDMNLDEYVKISERLEGFKDSLFQLESKFSFVQKDIDITQEKLQETIYQVNTIVENLKLIHQLEKNMGNLKKLLKQMKKIDEKIELQNSINGFNLLKMSYLIIEMRDNYQNLIDKCVHSRQICGKYEIIHKINDKYNKIVSILEQRFVGNIQQKIINKEDLSILIQCFCVLGRQKTPEKLLIQFILKPEMDNYYQILLNQKSKFIKATKQEFMEEMKKDSPLDQFSENIQSLYLQYGTRIDEALSLTPNYPFTFKQMLIELVYIYLSQKDCQFIYAVGVPDQFHRNFLTIFELKETLGAENRNSETEKKFYEKWNLNTYYSMRYNQIVRSYEQQMSDMELKIGKFLSDDQEVPFSSVLNRKYQQLEIKRNFKKSHRLMHFQEGSKFIKLLLQIVSRFAQQIASIIKEKQLINGNGVKQILSTDMTFNLCDLWQSLPSEITEQLTQYYSVGELQSLKNQISEKLLQLTSEFIEITIQPIIQLCFQNLEVILIPFNGIPAKFRMTNRETPKEASNFTGNILRPLQNYLQKTNLHRSMYQLIQLKQELVMVIFEVCKQVYCKFSDIKLNVLEACEKQERLMQKLGVQQKKADAETDSQKIKMQFDLDQIEILQNIKDKFDVNLE